MSEDLERWRAWIGRAEETDGKSAALWVADAQGLYASRGAMRPEARSNWLDLAPCAAEKEL